jgi:type I restriction enzyme S subunit
MKMLQKETWDNKKLGEICGFKNGFNFGKGYLETGFKVINVFDFQDYFSPNYSTLQPLVADRIPSEEYLLKKNDIVFVRSNGNKELIGRTLLVDEEPFRMTFSAFCIRARLHSNNLLPKYLVYFAKSDVFKIKLRSLVRGTYIGNISQGLLSNVSIPIPPIDEQERIIELMQSIEQSIVNAEKQEKNLCDLRKTLINKLKRIKPTFGNLVDLSKCKKVTIGDVSKDVSDRAENPSQSAFDRFVGLEDFESGEVNISSWSSTDGLVSAMKLFKAEDVLFARRNAYLKRTSKVDFDGVCSGDAIVIRVMPDMIFPMFLTLIMNTDEFWDFAISNAAGTMSKRVKWRDLETYSFVLPDIKTQETIVNVFTQIETCIAQIRQQKETLKKLKQKLLNEILG